MEDIPSDQRSTFYEKGPDGLIRQYDVVTGETLQILGGDAWASRTPPEFVKIEGPDGKEILVQKNINLEEALAGKQGVLFNPILADLICQKISDGASLKKVSEEMNIRYGLIASWRRKFREFSEALDRAYQDRADYLADRAIEEAEQADQTVAGVAKAKLINDTLWKAAEVANGKKYSSKVKHEGKIDVPLKIVIETGIRRSEDAGFLVDETAKMQLKKPVPSLEPGKVEVVADEMDQVPSVKVSVENV